MSHVIVNGTEKILLFQKPADHHQRPVSITQTDKAALVLHKKCLVFMFMVNLNSSKVCKNENVPVMKMIANN
jgi:hypothetical protein